jgi:hypothetical protein
VIFAFSICLPSWNAYKKYHIIFLKHNALPKFIIFKNNKNVLFIVIINFFICSCQFYLNFLKHFLKYFEKLKKIEEWFCDFYTKKYFHNGTASAWQLYYYLPFTSNNITNSFLFKNSYLNFEHWALLDFKKSWSSCIYQLKVRTLHISLWYHTLFILLNTL